MSLQELKEHKRAVEKLGRKQKDEVDRRTKELRERHAAELSRLKSQLEVCNTVTEAENFGTGNRHSTISGGETGPGAEGISLYGPQETRSKQKSKSQRRREAKAAHEAEREARILAEKEAQGPTERALEEERLMGLLLPLSLSIKEVSTTLFWDRFWALGAVYGAEICQGQKLTRGPSPPLSGGPSRRALHVPCPPGPAPLCPGR